MSAEKKRAEGYKAFRILHAVRFPDDSSFNRSDYYETKDKGAIDKLTRCMGHTAYEVDLLDATPVQAKRVLPPAPPAAAPAPELVDDDPDRPDFGFMTIGRMRAWLDACGVQLPPKAGSKSKHEEVCSAAWEGGHCPRPFFGLPGGPEPSPGIAGPPANDAGFIREVILAAEKEGIDVPKALRVHLEALEKEKPDPEPETPPAPPSPTEDENADHENGPETVLPDGEDRHPPKSGDEPSVEIG